MFICRELAGTFCGYVTLRLKISPLTKSKKLKNLISNEAAKDLEIYYQP